MWIVCSDGTIANTDHFITINDDANATYAKVVCGGGVYITRHSRAAEKIFREIISGTKSLDFRGE